MSKSDRGPGADRKEESEFLSDAHGVVPRKGTQAAAFLGEARDTDVAKVTHLASSFSPLEPHTYPAARSPTDQPQDLTISQRVLKFHVRYYM